MAVGVGLSGFESVISAAGYKAHTAMRGIGNYVAPNIRSMSVYFNRHIESLQSRQIPVI